MSNQLRSQLEKIDIPIEWVSEDELIIKRVDINSFNNSLIEVGKCYLFEIGQTEVAKNILKIASDNWNDGRYIDCSGLSAEVIKVLGDMIQVNGVGYDLFKDEPLNSVFYNYWLNKEAIRVIKIIQ